MNTANLILKILGLILKPLADAFGEDETKVRAELSKRLLVTDTSAEKKEQEIRNELPDA